MTRRPTADRSARRRCCACSPETRVEATPQSTPKTRGVRRGRQARRGGARGDHPRGVARTHRPRHVAPALGAAFGVAGAAAAAGELRDATSPRAPHATAREVASRVTAKLRRAREAAVEGRLSAAARGTRPERPSPPGIPRLGVDFAAAWGRARRAGRRRRRRRRASARRPWAGPREMSQRRFRSAAQGVSGVRWSGSQPFRGLVRPASVSWRSFSRSRAGVPLSASARRSSAGERAAGSVPAYRRFRLALSMLEAAAPASSAASSLRLRALAAADDGPRAEGGGGCPERTRLSAAATSLRRGPDGVPLEARLGPQTVLHETIGGQQCVGRVDVSADDRGDLLRRCWGVRAFKKRRGGRRRLRSLCRETRDG